MNYDEIAKWSQIISALLFMVVLVWLWARFIQPAIIAAQQNKNKQIAEAERHRDEAKAALEALRNEIDTAKHDAQLIRQRADVQAKRESDATVSEAREAGERSLRNAQGELERARAAAREQFRDRLANEALALARKEAATRVDAGMNAKLVDRFVASLETELRNGRGGRVDG